MGDPKNDQGFAARTPSRPMKAVARITKAVRSFTNSVLWGMGCRPRIGSTVEVERDLLFRQAKK